MPGKRKFAPWAALLLLIGILMIWVEVFCFDKAFYVREYAKLDIAQDIGITEQSLGQVTEALLDYLKGDRAELQISVEMDGRIQPFFSERELLHMVDVKALYQTAKNIGFFCLGLGAALLVWLLWDPEKLSRHSILTGYLQGNGLFFLLIAAIGLFVAIDFDTFWTLFHKTFFTNDLWLLDPNVDMLIRLVPAQFFFDLVIRIALAAVGSIAALFGGAWFWRRRLGKELNHASTNE